MHKHEDDAKLMGIVVSEKGYTSCYIDKQAVSEQAMNRQGANREQTGSKLHLVVISSAVTVI
jgi:hypothetical protein